MVAFPRCVRWGGSTSQVGDNDNNLNDDVSSRQNNVQLKEDHNNNNIYDDGKDDDNTLDKMVMILFKFQMPCLNLHTMSSRCYSLPLMNSLISLLYYLA